MKAILVAIALTCLIPPAVADQIVAGTPEDKSLQRITTETNPENKLQAILEFERQFPQSKALPDVYLMAVEIYRQKGERTKVLEYGERTLKIDQGNVNATMVLARNYAIEGKSVDRALALAQQAVDRIVKLKGEAVPPSYSESQWKDYLQSTETAARSILNYAKSVKAQKSPR